jgi:hypothetical protein
VLTVIRRWREIARGRCRRSEPGSIGGAEIRAVRRPAPAPTLSTSIGHLPVSPFFRPQCCHRTCVGSVTSPSQFQFPVSHYRKDVCPSCEEV